MTTNNYFKVSIRVTPQRAGAIGLPPGGFHSHKRQPGPNEPIMRNWLFFFDGSCGVSARVAWEKAHEVWSELHDKHTRHGYRPSMSVFGLHAGDITADLIGDTAALELPN
jgi:hypothetical protein